MGLGLAFLKAMGEAMDIITGNDDYIDYSNSSNNQPEEDEPNDAQELSFEEQGYLDFYTDMLEDYGEIGPRERKQLKREADRLGISESRVKELEASLGSSDSSDSKAEQEYLEKCKEIQSDYGEIGPREHKQLDRLRERLGISKERAKEIEQMLD